MNVQKIINSRFGVETVLFLGRLLPPRAGYALADLAARILSRQKNLAPVRAVRANQWVVSGFQASAAELDELVWQTYRNAAHCVYDFYHLLRRKREMEARIRIDPTFEAVFQRSVGKETGTIICLAHVGNFDLLGTALAYRGMRFQAITPAVDFSGYQAQNRMRAEMGIDATPASLEAVRMATERLRAGGTVVTGVDRPLPGSHHSPIFFGLPASLPTAHVRLALRLKLPLFVMGSGREGDGRYAIWAYEALHMQHCADPDEEILENSRAVLRLIEDNIRRFPAQWNMTYPVWPQIMAEVP